MTLAEFKDQMDGAPYSLQEFAEVAYEIEDNPEIQSIAATFINAYEQFEWILEKHEIEMG